MIKGTEQAESSRKNLSLERGAGSQSISNGSGVVDVSEAISEMETFQQGNMRQRLAMVKSFAEAGDARSIEHLFMAVVDAYALVRSTAVEELDKIGEPLGRLIFQSLDGSADAREQLVQLTDLRSIRAIASVLGQSNTSRHYAAYNTLLKVNDRNVIDPLLKILLYGNIDARVAAVYILRKFRDPRVEDALIAAATEKRAEVRVAAMYSLGELVGERSLNSLLVGLEDVHPSVREAAAYSLGSYNDKPAAAAPLIEALSDRSLRVQVAATWTIGSYRDSSSVEPLLRNLRSDDYKLPIAAAYSLGQLQNEQAIEPLVSVLDNQRASVELRVAVSYALGEIADGRAVDSLIGAMDSEFASIRESAFRSATKIVDPRLTVAFLDGVGDKRAETRDIAWRSLRASEDPTAGFVVGMLEGTLSQAQISVAREDPVAMSIMTDALANPSGDVRRSAARGLSIVEDTRVVQSLTEMAGGWNLYDKLIAIGALAKVCGPFDFIKNFATALLRPPHYYTSVYLWHSS